jgi:2-polyprenyl-3-methyl-5-hydroxy-6-metoxy-1,4-benzoquinol methylase
MSARRRLRRAVRRAGKRVVFPITHSIGRATGRHYFEDFVRVYPDGFAYSRLGLRRKATREDELIFLNHAKVYRFAAQFVRGKRVADVGCGSGYGCRILKEAGAAKVYGCDVSRHSLRFAERHFGSWAEFSRRSITDLGNWPEELVDVAVCSEVLEHVKEYGLEDRALSELCRILAPGGLLVLGTPNGELLGEHGFLYDEIEPLVRRHFHRFLLFENALVPFEATARSDWHERAAVGRTGIVVSHELDWHEVVVPQGANAEAKLGLDTGRIELDSYSVDTKLLHNTHGWIVLGVKERGTPGR